MRKQLNIFMENEKPLNGKWTFDKDNRSKLDEKTYQKYINRNIEKNNINNYTKNDLLNESISYIFDNFNINNFSIYFDFIDDKNISKNNSTNNSKNNSTNKLRQLLIDNIKILFPTCFTESKKLFKSF